MDAKRITMKLLYVLFAIFLYVEIGGLWGIANQIEHDVDYFIDCYYLIFTDAVG